jgi:hypothetical protein
MEPAQASARFRHNVDFPTPSLGPENAITLPGLRLPGVVTAGETPGDGPDLRGFSESDMLFYDLERHKQE